MKRLTTAAALGALLLTPTLALAHPGHPHTIAAASTTAPVPPRPGAILPKPGPAIRGIIENTRAGIKGVASTTVGGVRGVASTTREQVKARVDAVQQFLGDRKEELRGHLMDRKMELRVRADALKERAKERYSVGVQTSVGNMVDRLDRALDELSTLADRAEARIKEHESAGKSMTDSAALLAAARIDIAAAQDASLALSAALEAALQSDTPKAQMDKVRAAAKAAQDALQTAKKSLKDTLGQMRIEASAGASAEAAI